MRIRIWAAALLLAACGGTGDSATPSPEAVATTTQPTAAIQSTEAETNPSIAAGGLVIESIDFDAGVMTLRNSGDSAYDTSGHWICNRPSYSDVASTSIAPGATLEVDVSGIGARAGDGEIGLYTSNDFGNPDDIVAYVQWGSSGHGRESVAVSAGLWNEGDSLPGDQSVVRSTSDRPVSASDWTEG